MRQLVIAALVLLGALGVQLAMVAGVLRPNLALAFLGYAGLFVGAFLIVPAALRRAMRRPADPRPGDGPHRDGPHRHGPHRHGPL
ncbi:MAG: hypothetical protein ACXIU7_04320 [Roseinatronobacter sp.]